MAVTDLIFEPRVNITPSRIVSFTHVEGGNKRTGRKPNMPSLEQLTPTHATPLPEPDTGNKYLDVVFREAREEYNNQIKLANLKAEKCNGTLSHNAKKRMSIYINWMYALSESKSVLVEDINKKVNFRMNFLTLTLCAQQAHSDDFIKRKMLNRLLEILRRKHAMQSYIWRAEAQKNGNIHFHITTNVYVHYLQLRKYWISVLDRYGYLDRFEAKHRIEHPNDVDHRNPNCTDVKSIYKISNLAGYLCKYLSKSPDEGYRVIEGRQWYVSSNFAKIKPIGRTFIGDVRDEIERFTRNSKTYYHKETDSITGQEKLIAIVFYADIFSRSLKSYPHLAAIKKEAVNLYSELINDKPMTLQILTAKCYMKLFNCSMKLAKKMISDDRKKLAVKRLTPRLIMDLHALKEEDFAPLYS